MISIPTELDLYKFCPHCGNDLVAKTIDRENVKACTKCDFIFWNKPKPVVSAIIHHEGKVLMIQRANEPFKNYWVLPGGFISYDEIAEEAIGREVKEETGTDIQLETIIGTYKVDMDPRGRHLDIIFSGTTDEKIKLSEEDKKWQYFAPEDLPEHIAYRHRQAMLDWYIIQKND